MRAIEGLVQVTSPAICRFELRELEDCGRALNAMNLVDSWACSSVDAPLFSLCNGKYSSILLKKAINRSDLIGSEVLTGERVT